MPPNIKSRVPSHTNPNAAHPGGISPWTAGTNHWFVTKEKMQSLLKQDRKYSINLNTSSATCRDIFINK